MNKYSNTYNHCNLTFLSYPSKEGGFVFACEQLCLVIEDKDYEKAKLKILANAKSYLENVIEHKLGEHLLNQELPDEIIKEFRDYIRENEDNFERWIQPLEKMIDSSNLCPA
jgi:CRISPR/Cas system-associated endonuclease/helicase Cas3